MSATGSRAQAGPLLLPHPRRLDADAGPVSEQLRRAEDRNGVYALIRNYPPGLMVDGNSVFIIGETGVVVVDAPEASSDMLAALRKLTPLPVQYVINTHWHDDHIMGNHVCRDAFPGVRFIGHESMLTYLPGKGLENRKGMIEGAPQYAAQEREVLASNRHHDGTELTAEERAAFASDVRLVDRHMVEVPGLRSLPTDTVKDRKTFNSGAGRSRSTIFPGTRQRTWSFTSRRNGSPSPGTSRFSGALVGSPQSRVGLAKTCTSGRWAPPRMCRVMVRFTTILTRPGWKVDGRDRRRGDGRSRARRRRRGARRRAGLADLRKQFAGKSKLPGFLFDVYVSGPAVDSRRRCETAGRIRRGRSVTFAVLSVSLQV
jgi:hypothetical protein